MALRLRVRPYRGDLDTNVVMDFLLGRNSASYRLIVAARRCRHQLFISQLTIRELENQGLLSEFDMFRIFCRHKLEQLPITDSDADFARLLPTHMADAVHYAVARSCDAIVTWNVKDFPFERVMTPNDFK